MTAANLFLMGAFISRLGDSFSFLAFILVLTKAGASGVWVSAFMILHYLPGILIGLFFRPIVDRFPKRNFLIYLYLFSALITLVTVPFLDSPIYILIASGLLGVCYGLYVPLQRASIAEVVSASEARLLTGRLQVADSMAKLFGFALAGVVFNRLGAEVSLFLDAVSFVAIALCLYRIRFGATQVENASLNTEDLLLESRLVWVSIVFASGWLCTGALFSLEAAYARDFLRASESEVGLIFALATAGSVAIPTLIKRYGGRLDSFLSLTVFVILEAIGVSGYALSRLIETAYIFAIFYGFFLTLRHFAVTGWINREISPSLSAQAFALQQAISNLFMLLGMGFAGPSSVVLGVRAVLLVGVMTTLAVAFVAFWLGKVSLNPSQGNLVESMGGAPNSP